MSRRRAGPRRPSDPGGAGGAGVCPGRAPRGVRSGSAWRRQPPTLTGFPVRLQVNPHRIFMSDLPVCAAFPPTGVSRRADRPQGGWGRRAPQQRVGPPGWTFGGWSAVRRPEKATRDLPIENLIDLKVNNGHRPVVDGTLIRAAPGSSDRHRQPVGPWEDMVRWSSSEVFAIAGRCCRRMAGRRDALGRSGFRKARPATPPLRRRMAGSVRPHGGEDRHRQTAPIARFPVKAAPCISRHFRLVRQRGI